MSIREMKQVVNMFHQEWDLGKEESRAVGKTCAWIYLFEVLGESEEIFLEKDGNEVIGICGYARWNSKKFLIRKKFYRFLKNLLIYSPLIKNRRAMLKYNKDYDFTPKDMEDYFDGEISILIVDKNYRGKGIGKKIFEKALSSARKSGMKNIEILTDESSNYHFYERIGCQKVYETTVMNGEPGTDTEQGYIYEYQFN